MDEIAKCCSALVPGMEKRDVAALMVKMDGSGDGYLDYRWVRLLLGRGLGVKGLRITQGYGIAGRRQRGGEDKV